MKPLILGVAASLRNARWGTGARNLIADIRDCRTEVDLSSFLSRQANLHLDQFVAAGRREGRAFDEIYRELRKLSGQRGLSNSEVALAAALWSAAQSGCEIDHVSLSEHFPANGGRRGIDRLKAQLRSADGILISTPVYFGDRGSLAQELVDLLRDDPELLRDMQGKIYAGVAVGAKRNGGQETTLIYQLLDMIEMGLLGVGNDSDTTSQYGGTGHAGDVGTMPQDQYGLETSMGTGRRLAHVAGLRVRGRDQALGAPLKVQFWILQDKDSLAFNYVQRLSLQFKTHIEASVVNVADRHVTRCIACDICPTHVSVDQEYRCIIRRGGKDVVGDLHTEFLDQDAVIPVCYSPADRRGLETNYQKFIERTRYLRRGDYVLGDTVVAPLVLKDMNVEENLHVRAATSMIRHHTVLSRPMIGYVENGTVRNTQHLTEIFSSFVAQAGRLTVGRLSHYLDASAQGATKYQPVGYVLSAAKDVEDEKLQLREQLVSERRERHERDANLRLNLERKRAG